jgi:hypothetical protein
MSHRKFGLRAFGLSILAVLGLMAVMAAGAQAEYKVAGVKLTANEAVAVETDETGNLLVPAQELEIKCTEVEGENLTLVPETEVTGKLKFKNCVTFQKKAESKNCKPVEPITAGGKGHLVLNAAKTKTYVLFEPNKNAKNEFEPFTVVHFGELCALGEENPVTGFLAAECLTEALVANKCETEQAKHLLKQAPATEFADELKFGKNPATLDGVAAAKLNGKNATKLFSAVV